VIWQTSRSEYGLIQKCGFESQISFGRDFGLTELCTRVCLCVCVSVCVWSASRLDDLLTPSPLSDNYLCLYLCMCVSVCVSVCVWPASRLDDLLTPAPLSDKSLENHTVFRVPIIVVPGELLTMSTTQVQSS